METTNQPQTQETIESQEGFRFQDYWRVVKKRKWIILSVFIVTVVSVSFYNHRLRLVYKATSRILIETERPNIMSFEDVLQIDTASYEYIETQFEIVKSRQLIGKVIDELDLQNSVEFFPKTPSNNNSTSVSNAKKWVVNKMKGLFNALSRKEDEQLDTVPLDDSSADQEIRKRERLYRGVKSRISVNVVGDSRLVDISFVGFHPHIITKIVNTLTRLYIDQNLESRVFASEDATQWLDQKLKSMQKKVEESERELQLYSRQSGAFSLEHKEEILDNQIAQINSALMLARKKRITLETLYKTSQNPELAESLTEIVNNQLIQQLNLELANLKKRASELGKKYGPKHPKIILIASQVEEITKTLKLEVQKIHESILTDLELARAGEQSLLDTLAELENEASTLQDKAIGYGVLKRKMESNRNMFALLLQRLKETDLSQGYRSNNIRLVDPALQPSSPFKPDKRKNVILGMVLGLLGGLGLAFVVENLDNSVKEPDEILTRFGIPFLGLVGSHNLDSGQFARKGGEASSGSAKLITIADPSSSIAESLRTIRTNVLFSADGDKQKIVMVTSALPSEGKTTVASNLAVVMASLGEKVLLVDADLRRPSVHKVFGVSKSPGLSSHLIHQNEYEQILVNTEVKNLTVIPSGIIPPNPSELLSHPQLQELLNKGSKTFDRIIIDTPPVASVSDPMIISKSTGGVIIVIRTGETARDIVMRAVQQLKNVRANVMGAVLNAVDFSKDSYYYQYYYKHYYYQEDGAHNT